MLALSVLSLSRQKVTWNRMAGSVSSLSTLCYYIIAKIVPARRCTDPYAVSWSLLP